jgi:carboxymethylenebutenolidase
MQITKRNVELQVDGSLMRVYIVAPKPEGCYPGILFYSDIYQLGEPITRLADHLAGYGYVVAAPEIFHRLLPIGTVMQPMDLGRMQGNDAARRTEVHEYDADTQALLNFLKQEPTVASGQIGAMGFCIGGHLTFRAALQPEVNAAACIYPTGIHSGKLGKEPADSLQRVSEIKAELLMIFGSIDPHVPEVGRNTILQALESAKISHKVVVYENADHTFMRDDGHRYDPVATDAAWGEITTFFKKKFENS